MAIVVMMCTGIFPFLTYGLPAISGFLLCIIVIEINVKWALLSYLSIAILGLFLVPDKESALLFLMFLGYYPVVKSIIESKLKKVMQYIVKCVLFNISMVISYFLVTSVLNISVLTESFEEYESVFLLVMLLMGNVIFFIYDNALSQLISLYLYKYRSKLFKRLY